MKVLVINCGSSSIKFQLLEMENEMLLAKGHRNGWKPFKISWKARICH